MINSAHYKNQDGCRTQIGTATVVSKENLVLSPQLFLQQAAFSSVGVYIRQHHLSNKDEIFFTLQRCSC